MNGDNVHFCRDHQRVSLHPQGMDSEAVAPSTPKMRRIVLAALAFITVILAFSLVVLFAVVLQSPRPATEDASFQKFTGDNTTGKLPVDPCKLQMFKCHVENPNTWSMEIQMLMGRVDNVSSQVQMLSGHLEDTSADVQMAKNLLKDANTLRIQTQMLRSSLEGANIEIQKLKGDVEEANALNFQIQSFLRSSSENTSTEIQLLRGHLERACNKSRLLQRDLETVTTQAEVAKNRLDQTDAQIHALKTELKDMSSSNSQSTETLTRKIQETQGHLETFLASTASQEQLQKTQNQLLELILKGWNIYEGNLYYFSHIKKSWHEAEQFCVSQGAHLASVTSVEEQAFLVKFTQTSNHWIGLTDRGTEGFWRWVDGTPFNNAQSRVPCPKGCCPVRRHVSVDSGVGACSFRYPSHSN
ncbi:PREDICTED: C-type lectin domain family 4 member F [Condylura cristata]|uniref:C-type lectin domain family 4 member F n=1 Tax=Condylura cristata TaxID=143302 RepID=UPI000643BBDC|nr:PREDICTED: C-type lectin domain family 4 member F [Condylura cristata]